MFTNAEIAAAVRNAHGGAFHTKGLTVIFINLLLCHPLQKVSLADRAKAFLFEVGRRRRAVLADDASDGQGQGGAVMSQQGGLGDERHSRRQISGRGQARLADQGASAVGEERGSLTAGVTLRQGGGLLGVWVRDAGVVGHTAAIFALVVVVDTILSTVGTINVVSQFLVALSLNTAQHS